MPVITLPQWFARYVAIIWTIGIFAATLMPSSQVPNPGTDWPIDKVVHFILFFGFGILWMRGLFVRFRTRLISVIAIGIAIALLTEVFQAIFPYGRTAEIADIAINIFGLLAGVAAFRFWWHKYSRPALGQRELS